MPKYQSKTKAGFSSQENVTFSQLFFRQRDRLGLIMTILASLKQDTKV